MKGNGSPQPLPPALCSTGPICTPTRTKASPNLPKQTTNYTSQTSSNQSQAVRNYDQSKPRDQIMQTCLRPCRPIINAWYPVVRTCAPNAPTKPTTICLNSSRWILISIGLVRSRPSSRFKGPQSLNLYTIVVRLLQLPRPFQIKYAMCTWHVVDLTLAIVSFHSENDALYIKPVMPCSKPIKQNHCLLDPGTECCVVARRAGRLGPEL